VEPNASGISENLDKIEKVPLIRLTLYLDFSTNNYMYFFTIQEKDVSATIVIKNEVYIFLRNQNLANCLCSNLNSAFSSVPLLGH
jgi:hypothetical protein